MSSASARSFSTSWPSPRRAPCAPPRPRAWRPRAPPPPPPARRPRRALLVLHLLTQVRKRHECVRLHLRRRRRAFALPGGARRRPPRRPRPRRAVRRRRLPAALPFPRVLPAGESSRPDRREGEGVIMSTLNMSSSTAPRLRLLCGREGFAQRPLRRRRRPVRGFRARHHGALRAPRGGRKHAGQAAGALIRRPRVSTRGARRER